MHGSFAFGKIVMIQQCATILIIQTKSINLILGEGAASRKISIQDPCLEILVMATYELFIFYDVRILMRCRCDPYLKICNFRNEWIDVTCLGIFHAASRYPS